MVHCSGEKQKLFFILVLTVFHSLYEGAASKQTELGWVIREGDFVAYIERRYEYSSLFIVNGIYDTLEAMGGSDTMSFESNLYEKKIIEGNKIKIIEGWLTIFGKLNLYRFIARSKPYGCLLSIESINPRNVLSSETEKRLLTSIICALDQLLEDAIIRSYQEKSLAN